MDFLVRPRLGFEPNADVFVDEERGEVIVAVEVAGVDPDSLRIELDDDALLISGRRTEFMRFGRGSFAQKEIAYGVFSKRVPLPVPIDAYSDTVATYSDGVLVAALPISPTAYLPVARTQIRMIVKRTLS